MPIPQLNQRHTRTYGAMGMWGTDEENSPPTPPKKKKHRQTRWAYWLKILLAFLAAGFVFGSLMVAWISRDLPDPNKLSDRQVAESTKIYDRTGTHLLYEVYQNQKRTQVNIDQMSPWIPKATVAVEDKYFYEHNGVRITSIARAAINNLLGRKAGSGGASTITQQLIKNTIIGNEHSYFRKLKEAILALQLEKKYSKEEILQMYLNEVPYGSTNYGVESASQSYFKKSAHDLDLSEAATLAAIIQAPTRYLNNPDLLRDRRDLVLRLMFDQGMITEAEKTAAQAMALRVYRTGGIMDAPHFVLYVRQQLADKYGEKTVDTSGMKVITTIDYDKQKAAEQIVKENGDKFAKDANANNAALVALDPKTGQILAMVGSRDFNNDAIDGQFNVAVLAKRQPGSSFKPFVYLAAFEKGYTPETVIYDVSTNFDRRSGGNYTPKNYDGKDHGLITMRSALQGSLNIPAVKTLYLVGPEKVSDIAARFGYTDINTTTVERAGLSLVLGGAEVNLLEHTSAYATLANNGVYHAPISILQIKDASNNSIFEATPDPGTEAVTPDLAARITNVLSDDAARAYIFGAHGSMTLPDRPVAAKTGTTNDNKDAWTMGYVPSLATGVWVGNTIPSPMKGNGNTLAGKIWNQFMATSTAKTPKEDFPVPPPDPVEKPVLRGAVGGITLPINVATGRIAASSTPPEQIVTKTYLPPHDILHYVNKDDPRGPVPANPADDPQYQNWESGLAEWVERLRKKGEQVSLEDPPTATDGGGSPELQPQVSITSPQNAITLSSRDLVLAVTATAPRGVTRVTYSIDGHVVGTSDNYPFTLNYHAAALNNGEHTLTAVAEDDMGNSGQAVINFSLQAPTENSGVIWSDGANITLSASDYPRPLELIPAQFDQVKKIQILLKANNVAKLIYTFSPAEDLTVNGRLSFTWQHYPGAGTYILTAQGETLTGQNFSADLAVVVK